MSDTLIIDTGSSAIKETKIEPLPLFDENHPLLEQVMPEYEAPLPNPNIINLIERMKLTMRLFGGIGLSANQCGIAQRIFIIGTDQFQITCINPKLISSSNETIKENEGCLSYPGLYLKIERPKSIEVEFLDINGKVTRLWLDGITARCFLHELDHMNGKKFTDKVGNVSMRMARQKQQKLLKKVSKRLRDKK